MKKTQERRTRRNKEAKKKYTCNKINSLNPNTTLFLNAVLRLVKMKKTVTVFDDKIRS